MDKPELSEEEVFSNDLDPLEAINAIRREEGVAEEDLAVADPGTSDKEVVAEVPAGEDELNELETPIPDDKPSEEETAADADDQTEKTKDVADKDPEEGDPEPDKEEGDTVDNTAEIHKFSANGQEFDFTEAEMIEKFPLIFGQAMDYTQKTQKMAPFRKMISALETEGITSEQLNTAIDAIKGNKQALQSIMENHKIDAFDIAGEDTDTTSPYNPTPYGKDETQLNIQDIQERISGDEEFKITQDVIDNQWDQKSRDMISQNPEMIQGLHNDIKSGLYDKVAPAAMKKRVLDGNTKSNIEYYMLAGQELAEQQKQNSDKSEQTVSDADNKTQAAEDDFDQASSEASKKRSASPTRTRADRKGVTDYLNDDNDEEYDAWYQKLMASQ